MNPVQQGIFQFFASLRTPLCKITSTGKIEQWFRVN